MGKKLAIRGHTTRGKEVIELLQMMGGTNPFSKNDGIVIGNKTNNCYYISEDTASKYISWDYIGPEEIDKYEIFTLEEFLEEYPHRVGDKVVDGYGNSLTIKSMSWSEDWETMVYDFEDAVIVLAAEDLKPVDDADDDTEPTKMKNVLAELLEHIKTTPKEELEREFEEIKEWSNVGPTVEEFMTFCECVNKKLVYPKTYDECCKNVLGMVHWGMTVDVPMHYSPLIINFTKLLICRDAYWKIAGEKMGLDGPWKPDWLSGRKEEKYCIATQNNEIWYNFSEYGGNEILAFPTIEMRDAFYENFKELIEECKELL